MFTLTAGVFVLCTAATFVAGFVDAIAGGSGLITIPTLLLAGVPPHLALGVNKVSACLGTFVALVNFAKSRLIFWKLALFGVVFAIVGSNVGSLLTLQVQPDVLGKIMIFLLPVAMIATFLPKKKRGTPLPPRSGKPAFALNGVLSFLLGIYDGFFGPGTGSFFILAYHWLLRMDLLEASATAKVANLATNFGAVVIFVWHGKVIWPLAIAMAVASMTGNWLGSRMAIRIGASVVRKCLLLSLFLLFVTLVWRYFLA